MSRVNATPLDATAISEMLPTHTRNALDIVVLDVVGSTNDIVRDGYAAGGCHGLVAFAEQQTAGRGRRGKTWHSPAGANIYCSVGWQCQGALASLSGLSLAVGAILAESVAAHLGIQLQLKWPTTFSIRNVNSGACWLNCWVSKTAAQCGDRLRPQCQHGQRR